MSNEQQQPQLLLGIITEKKDRNGNRYFIGDFNGLLTMTMFKKKDADDKWVVRLSQKEKREGGTPPPANDGFGF